ncbi:MAG: carbohydrate kinase [Clostridiales bacterium]|nr:carbohydrate kinase [Clostridiales bacterium]
MKITTIGEILVDMTQTHIDDNGIPHFAANPGGAPANVAVAAAKLGVSTAFIGCVGDDSYGKLLRDTLVRFGVNVDGLQVTAEASTTLAIVTVDTKGERSFSFYRKPGADTRIDAARAIRAAEGAGILHFGSVSLTDPACREAVVSTVRAAKAAGTLITYDPNYRAALWESEDAAITQMRAVLPLCDIVKISDEETRLLCGTADPGETLEKLMGLGVRLAVVTLGAKGAMWRCGGMEGRVPGCAVKVADTNGAGDTFFGAFLSRIALRGGLDGVTTEEINDYVRFANKAASITTSRPGAIPAMPTLREVQEG